MLVNEPHLLLLIGNDKIFSIEAMTSVEQEIFTTWLYIYIKKKELRIYCNASEDYFNHENN